MRKFALSVVLVMFSCISLFAQNYIFTGIIRYTGYSKTPENIEDYIIYFNPGDNSVIGFEHIDRSEQASNGVMILDFAQAKQILLDRREKTGISFPLQEIEPVFFAINLDSTGSKLVNKLRCITYQGQKNGKTYDYTVAITSPRVDTLFGILNGLGIDFILYPRGNKTLITEYTVRQNSDTLSHFKLEKLNIDTYIKFDTKKYRMRKM